MREVASTGGRLSRATPLWITEPCRDEGCQRVSRTASHGAEGAHEGTLNRHEKRPFERHPQFGQMVTSGTIDRAIDAGERAVDGIEHAVTAVICRDQVRDDSGIGGAGGAGGMGRIAPCARPYDGRVGRVGGLGPARFVLCGSVAGRCAGAAGSAAHVQKGTRAGRARGCDWIGRPTIRATRCRGP